MIIFVIIVFVIVITIIISSVFNAFNFYFSSFYRSISSLSTKRDLNLSYISILTNLLRTVYIYIEYWDEYSYIKITLTVTIWNYLKLVSAIFYQIFISHQMIALQAYTWKMFFFSSKKLFSFSRYSGFCISFFPSFSLCQPLL